MDLDTANMYADGIKRDINCFFEKEDLASLKWLHENLEQLLKWVNGKLKEYYEKEQSLEIEKRHQEIKEA